MSEENIIFSAKYERETVTAMKKAMMADITPEIMQRVLSVDPRVIEEKKKDIESNLATFTNNDSEHNCIWEINQFFNNWTANLPDNNYGEDISRHRQGSKIVGSLDGLRPFYGTIFASIITEGLDIGRILELNDENALAKSERHAELAKYTIPVIARLLALEYDFNDLRR